MSYDLGDYVDVQTRIKLFYEKYPDGSLQFEFKGVMPGSTEYIWGIAYAYRTPDDQRPAMGTASEAAQGKTAFTRGSELANLETSCWGRCLGALGLGIAQGIASKQEVENAKQRQTERELPNQYVNDSSFHNVQQKPVDPWEAESNPTIKMLGEMGMTPECVHGLMIRKEGNRKSDGKPYAGWVCPADNRSCAIWE